jgi:hypothetical protein
VLFIHAADSVGIGLQAVDVASALRRSLVESPRATAHANII